LPASLVLEDCSGSVDCVLLVGARSSAVGPLLIHRGALSGVELRV